MLQTHSNLSTEVLNSKPFKALEKWVKKHPQHEFIDFDGFRSKNSKFSNKEIIILFNNLVNSGYLKTYYVLESESGAICEDVYESYDEIPEFLNDEYGAQIPTSSYKPVLVFSMSST